MKSARSTPRDDESSRGGVDSALGRKRRLTLSAVLGLVTVTELDGLVDTGRGTTGDGGAEEAYGRKWGGRSEVSRLLSGCSNRMIGVPSSVVTSTGQRERGKSAWGARWASWTERTLDGRVSTRVPDLWAATEQVSKCW